MTAPTPNAELAYRVLDQIDAHPETWNQGTWDCGTAACFAGWALRMSGATIADGWIAYVSHGPQPLVGLDVDDAAYRALGITAAIAGDPHGDATGDDGDWLFAGSNTREDLDRLVAEIFGPRPERAS